ncbi:outer membrane lipid asymmetry maintenance protein MlaD [Oleomonas cavernae]|uniref:Outer membrane lipid asymmetry maintenance protein MlaD n=1 Tax=Oleomonas cavernae TaxID=2320859 RepID=A0A418WCY9_9PROT|nr:outer membrane lipid asymmetry maintenance protein MlaD [Oleomonas cavernae]RJF87902.1 outer membrane lipid asymmetry maintenance protein MlaD [Oleomonas cavernae]
MSSNLVETLIGAVVIGVAAVFLIFAYTNVGARTGGGYDVVARFDRVDGLPTGADVRISGIKVGSVTAQLLDPKTYRATVHLSISAGIELPDDSSAKIASEGLLGGAYIAIEPGGSDKPLQAGGEIKYTQSSVDLMGLISRAVFGSADGSNAGGGSPAPAPANP